MVIMGDGFELINMFDKVTYLSPGPSQPPATSPLPYQLPFSSSHKNSGDEKTVTKRLDTMMGHRWQRIRTSTQRLAFVGNSTPAARQTITTSNPTTSVFFFKIHTTCTSNHHQRTSLPVFVLETSHHQHLKPPPKHHIDLHVSTF